MKSFDVMLVEKTGSLTHVCVVAETFQDVLPIAYNYVIDYFSDLEIGDFMVDTFSGFEVFYCCDVVGFQSGFAYLIHIDP